MRHLPADMRRRILAIILVLALTANLVALAFGMNNIWVFWGIIIISAVIAYRVLPKIHG